MHIGHAAQAGAGDGGAVVAVNPADDHLLVRLPLDRPVMTHHAQHGVIAFRTRTGEEHMVHALRGQLRNRLGQLQRGRRGGLEEHVVVGQLLHLFRGGVCQFLATITNRHTPESGHGIEDLVALAVPQVHPVGLGDDARPIFRQLFEIAERREVVFAAHGLPLAGFRVGHLTVHNNTLITPAAYCRSRRKFLAVAGARITRASRLRVTPTAAGTHAPRN